MINTLPSFCFLFIKGPLFLLKSGNGLKIRIIISFLTKINNLNAKRQKRKEEIYEVIDRIPSSRKNCLAKYYIVAYTDDKETQDILYRFFANSTILKTPDLINDLDYNDYVILKSF